MSGGSPETGDADANPAPRDLAARDQRWWRYLRDFWDLPAGKWIIGIAAVAAVVVPVAIGYQSAADAPSSPGTETLTPDATASAPAGLNCLAYNGPDAEVSATKDYPEADFVLVECTRPHQYESVVREADVPCKDAITELTNRYSFSGSTRVKEAPYGPHSCAFGRVDGDTLQTDTYRVSAATDALSAFGACIEGSAVEGYLAGSSPKQLRCHSGRALTWYVTVSDGKDAEQMCAEAAVDIPNNGFRWAEDPVEGATPIPAVRCAFFLWGIAQS